MIDGVSREWPMESRRLSIVALILTLASLTLRSKLFKPTVSFTLSPSKTPSRSEPLDSKNTNSFRLQLSAWYES